MLIGVNKYIFIDGYNVINAWQDLKEISSNSYEEARSSLIEMLVDYKATTGYNVYVVFDAYKTKGKREKIENYKGVNIVFTKEFQTADSYIENKAHELKNPRNVVQVVTADGAQQQSILGSGAIRMTPLEFKTEIIRYKNKTSEHKTTENLKKSTVGDTINSTVLEVLNEMAKKNDDKYRCL